MIEGFKASLSQVNTLMWTAIALSVSLLLLDPNAQNTAVLGLPVSSSRLYTIVPLALVGLMFARQVIIRNIIDIVQRADDKTQLKELVLAYPIVEFMNWKFTTNLEQIALTVVIFGYDMLPSLSLGYLWAIQRPNPPAGADFPPEYKAAVALVFLLSSWNYLSLRYSVFQRLGLKVQTPD